ncbi:Transposon Ty3-G Gag-Pol polyprotein [Stylophora pistillata]|uniref:Transposon Ty3-G Gag-Pol polyprotein n=1 Tax=Stylophora pistillata TaxID=50429 RepID=A0A2B4RAR2_STYPI|nr:Transposon Ty3-G Gag-Pol polyprotein [Stylophora pistillata]
MDKLFEGVPVGIIVDDFLINGKDQIDTDQKLRRALARSREVGLKFNPIKVKLRVPEVSYVGHVFSADGWKPDPDKIHAISEMPPPSDKEGVLRILGTVNYLVKFIEHKAGLQKPISQLTQKDVALVWEKPQQEAFDKLKSVITSAPVLADFNNSKETVLSVDASNTGLGAVIMQEGKPVAFSSKTLTPSEQVYANIERELLAIVWGVQSFTDVYGRRVVVETDHKPLESIFWKPVNEAPPRLQRMLLKLTKYDLVVHYVPGKQQVISDCPSRAPLSETKPFRKREDVIGVNLVEELGLESSILKRFKDSSRADETSKVPAAYTWTFTVVMEYNLRGWPSEKEQVEELAREYWSFREELSVEDGMLFKSDRIVVPRPMRAEVFDEIHGAHMGENKSLSFARDYVFWPSMTAQIKDKVSFCAVCNAFRNRQQKESLHPHDIPGLPWQVVGTDLFQYGGQMYLLVTDFYSKYFEIELLHQNTAICVINTLKKIFARFGIPEKVVSDNRPQNSNTRHLLSKNHEFKRFTEEWGFSPTTSSPEYPQYNGAVERAVQTAKRILKKAAAEKKDPFEGLLKYRNTPFKEIGVSPAQLLMSWRTRTMLPTHRRLFLPQPVDHDHVLKTLHHRQHNAKSNYDRQSRDLPPLHVGDSVWFCPNGEKEWRKAEIMPRSYMLQDEYGRTYRRNRRQIITVPNDSPMTLRTRALPKSTQTHDSLPSTRPAPVLEKPVSTPVPSERQTETIGPPPITTKSGCQVRRPQRLIESR